MSSLEIAEVIGKPHNDLMKAIRKMVPAWKNVHGGNFSLKQRLVQTSNGASRLVPYYDYSLCSFCKEGLHEVEDLQPPER